MAIDDNSSNGKRSDDNVEPTDSLSRCIAILRALMAKAQSDLMFTGCDEREVLENAAITAKFAWNPINLDGQQRSLFTLRFRLPLNKNAHVPTIMSTVCVLVVESPFGDAIRFYATNVDIDGGRKDYELTSSVPLSDINEQTAEANIKKAVDYLLGYESRAIAQE